MLEAEGLVETMPRSGPVVATLDWPRARQIYDIRRLLEAMDIRVLRLVRVAIGPLQLGELPKGQWRELTAAEIEGLSP